MVFLKCCSDRLYIYIYILDHFPLLCFPFVLDVVGLNGELLKTILNFKEMIDIYFSMKLCKNKKKKKGFEK